jgi:hypothetical protein
VKSWPSQPDDVSIDFPPPTEVINGAKLAPISPANISPIENNGTVGSKNGTVKAKNGTVKAKNGTVKAKNGTVRVSNASSSLTGSFIVLFSFLVFSF